MKAVPFREQGQGSGRLAEIRPMALTALFLLVGGIAAADPHVPGPPLPPVEPRLQKGVTTIAGDEFTVASDDPYPSDVPTHFHSNNSDPFQVGADQAEVGVYIVPESSIDEEVRGLAEFPASSGGASSSTLSFEVTNVGGLFDQPGGDFEILLEAYVGNGLEELTDYSAPAIGTIARFQTGGLMVGDVFSYDITSVLAQALAAEGGLGVRLRPVSDPMGSAMVFGEFLIEKLARRASLGGLGAQFCPDSPVGKGSCTDPLGSGDRFGTSIEVSGNTVMIGVPGDDDAGQNSGALFVFLRDGDQLLFQQKIVPPPGFTAAGFGQSLAIEGGVAVVGSPDEPTFLRKGTGSLRAALLERLGTRWTVKQPITSPADMAGSGFGASVAISSNLMVIGAPTAGLASVFTFNGGFPVELDTFGPPGGKGFQTAFGRKVAVANDKFAIGAGSPLVAGAVGLFSAVANNLQNVANMTSTDASENFGASLAMDGDMVFVGAPQAALVAGETENRTGAVFALNTGGAMLGRFTPPTAFGGGQFGFAIAASGGRVAIGQPGPGPGGKGADELSRVYLFDAMPNDLVEVDQLVAQTPDEDGLGTTVALDLDNLLASSPVTGSIGGFLDTRGVFSDSFDGFDVSNARGDPGSQCPEGSVRREILFLDDMENGAPGWTVSGDGATWELQPTRATSGTNAWRATGVGAVSDQILESPPIDRPVALLSEGEGLVLSFTQFRDLEQVGNICFDGGVVEFRNPSNANGRYVDRRFVDVDQYTGPIATDTGNPLADVRNPNPAQDGEPIDAWCGNSGGSVRTRIVTGFGSPSTRTIRFRLGTDAATATEGWYIDDVMLEFCGPPEP
ncbi:MAG: hypothetical protein AAGE01_01645 [Pseudomonadota bacterium]